MLHLSEIGRKIWSLVAPDPVGVRLVSRYLPTGQLEITPEFFHRGQPVDFGMIPGRKNTFINGYRVRIPDHVLGVSQEYQGRTLRLRPRAVQEWLKKYADSGVPVVSSESGKPIRAVSAQVELDLDLKSDDVLVAKATLSTPEGVELDQQRIKAFPNEPSWFRLDETIFQRPELPPDLEGAIEAGEAGKILTGDSVPEFLGSLQNQPPEKIRGVRKSDNLKGMVVSQHPPQNQLRIDGNADQIQVRQNLAYLDDSGVLLEESVPQVEGWLKNREKEESYKRVPKGWVRVSRKDTEKARKARLQISARAARLDEAQGRLIPEVLAALAEEVRLNSPWNVYVSERVKDSHRLIDKQALVDFRLSVTDGEEGESFLQVDPLYRHDRQTLSHAEVGSAIKGDETWLRRPSSWVKIDRQKFGAVEEIVKAAARDNVQIHPHANGFAFPASQREEVIERLARVGRVEQSDSYSNFIRKLAEFNCIEHAELPRGLNKGISFYPYQQHGYNWLVFLRRFGLNGILADDMGLGKTLQALAVIKQGKELSVRGSEHPTLIICPVSLMANWRAEAIRFFPGTWALQYRGSNREKLRDQVYGADFVIASYSVAANDFDELASIPWNYIVIDEAHAIKNPDIQRTKKIKRLPSLHKLALTGTPVQNAATDLWSLFDFLMPGYLGSHPEFRSRYPSLFDRRTATFGQHATDLKKRVGPFVMRRLKKDVAAELPEKIVSDRIVELSEQQVRRYKELLAGTDATRLRHSIEQDNYKTEGINILTLMSKLRAICNHPVLESGASTWLIEESAKLDAFQQLLEEVVEGNHRALVFSQFVKMLDIIEHCLREWKIPNLRIDGKTVANLRQTIVDRFNQDQTYRCLLLSTRAGGVGLNLTGADTVIFYDHDWNPTNDLQAQDRAHRIGQKQTVTVYRLITKGTIEEKILKYQERKIALAQALIEEDKGGIKNLTREELLSLFSFEE
jgi:SNF2 family DNA or RNA helicase